MTLAEIQTCANAPVPGEWLIPWRRCLSARQNGLVPSDEQVFIHFGVPIRRHDDRWSVMLPVDSIAIRHAPLAIVAGIDCIVFCSGDVVSYGLISGLAKRLIDCGPRRLQLIDLDQGRCVFLKLAATNG